MDGDEKRGGGGGADFYINELQYCTLYSTYMGFAAWDSLKKYTKWEMYGEGKKERYLKWGKYTVKNQMK